MQKKIICHDIYGKEFEARSDQLIYRPSAYGVLIEDNKVLLSKQWDGYDLPGGGAKIDETLEETLKREFTEETGLKVEVLEPVFIKTSFFKPSHSEKHKDEFWNCSLMYFTVKKTGGSLSIENFDEEEKGYADMAEWIDLSKIKELKYINSVDTVKIIEKAL